MILFCIRVVSADPENLLPTIPQVRDRKRDRFACPLTEYHNIIDIRLYFGPV